MNSKKIASFKPAKKRYVVTDGFGLTLRVMPSGKKCWVFRLSEGGRVTDRTIGYWPEMTLKAARQEARRRRKEAGLVPQRGYVLEDAWRLWKNLKRGRIVSYLDEKRRMERYVISKIGSRQIDEISAPLVIHTVRNLDTEGKRATLKRVLMRTREVLDLAVCAGFIQHNPVERVSRVFAPPVVRPMPSIDWRELPSAMVEIAGLPRGIQTVFLLSLLTMLRPGEVAKLKWTWIDDDVLTIPGEEMKKARPHRVPLSPMTLRVLAAIKADSPHPRSGFVFPSKRDSSRHISKQALSKALAGTALRGRLVAHGLRSIARGWMADHSMPFEAAEACLAHVSGSSVSRAYQRSDYLEIRRTIMRDWSSFVSDCAESAGFLPEICEFAKEKP